MNTRIVDFNNNKNNLIKRKINMLTIEEKNRLLVSGTRQEKIALAELKYGLDILAKDASPEVRREVVKNTISFNEFVADPSSIVRHAVALRLKEILECSTPQITLDKIGQPYVIDTSERRMVVKLSKDLSAAVSTVAKQTLDTLKRRELKEAIQLVLSRGGMDDVACSLAKDLERSINEKMYSNDVDEIPVREATYDRYNRKAGVER